MTDAYKALEVSLPDLAKLAIKAHGGAGTLEAVRVSDRSPGSGRCSLGFEGKGRSPGARKRQSGFEERVGVALALCPHRSQIVIYAAAGSH